MAGQDDRATANAKASAFPGQSGLGMTKREYITLTLMAGLMDKDTDINDAFERANVGADKLLYRLS